MALDNRSPTPKRFRKASPAPAAVPVLSRAQRAAQTKAFAGTLTTIAAKAQATRVRNRALAEAEARRLTFLACMAGALASGQVSS